MTTVDTGAPLRYRLTARWRTLIGLPAAPAVRGVVAEGGLREETTQDLRRGAAMGKHIYVSDAILREPGEETTALGWTDAEWLRPRRDVSLDQQTQVIGVLGVERALQVPAGDPPLYRAVAAALLGEPRLREPAGDGEQTTAWATATGDAEEAGRG